MSAVRDEEQLHREGAADFVAIEIVGRTPWELFWVRFKRDRVAFAALGFIVLLVLVAIFAGPISSALGHPPDAQYPNKLDLFGTPTGPSSSFLFGVDQIGRDVSSRCARRSSSRPRVRAAPAAGRSSSAKSSLTSWRRSSSTQR